MRTPREDPAEAEKSVAAAAGAADAGFNNA
jgi:hypothetical protein